MGLISKEKMRIGSLKFVLSAPASSGGPCVFRNSACRPSGMRGFLCGSFPCASGRVKPRGENPKAPGVTNVLTLFRRLTSPRGRMYIARQEGERFMGWTGYPRRLGKSNFLLKQVEQYYGWNQISACLMNVYKKVTLLTDP